MGSVWGAALAGVFAGLGVAMPLGAVGTLLLRESMVGGFVVGAAAAAGVATVDLLYCSVATVTGTLFTRMIDANRGVFLVASGVLVVGIGVRQMVAGLRPRATDVALVAETGSAWAAYGRFAGLTAINPLTLVYFVALGGAAVAPGSSWGAPVAFVTAVGVASLGWQLTLATAGAVFRRMLGAKGVRGIGVAAALIVVGLGAGVLVRGVRALVGGA